MRVQNPPAPSFAFAYRSAPLSGNLINGLGETELRRAVPVFHNAGAEPLPWQALNDFFGLISPWPLVWQIIRNRWVLRHARGGLAKRQVAVADPAAMAERIKALAKDFGANLVGVCELTPDDQYAGAEVPFKLAICLGLTMDRDLMEQVPHQPAAVEVIRTYRRASVTAVKLARHIRAMGWPARAYSNPNSVDILQIPLAIRAGLGQLGKHGSVISKEYGSNFRLATVVTDLPMTLDTPVDIGVDDLCVSCRRCQIDCPPDAIFETKQPVRGTTKWYVDFDKCIPYFVKTKGCAICIEVCPWSEPGRGPKLSEKLLSKRTNDR